MCYEHDLSRGFILGWQRNAGMTRVYGYRELIFQLWTNCCGTGNSGWIKKTTEKIPPVHAEPHLKPIPKEQLSSSHFNSIHLTWASVRFLCKEKHIYICIPIFLSSIICPSIYPLTYQKSWKGICLTMENIGHT